MTDTPDTVPLITDAIAASGLTLGKFARKLMGRDRRTVLLWTQGAVIPAEAQRWLRTWLGLSPRVRAAIVRYLAS